MVLGSFFAVFSVRFCRLPSAAGPPSVTLHLVKKSSRSFGKGFSPRASVGFHCQPVDSGAAETGSANKDEAIQPPERGYTHTHAPQSSSAFNHMFSVRTVRIRPLSCFTCFRLASASSNTFEGMSLCCDKFHHERKRTSFFLEPLPMKTKPACCNAHMHL